MEPIKFSIITCVYNLEDFVSRAIESVLNQDFKNFELVLVNDCSTDGTLSVLKKYSLSHPNIVIIDNEKNMGLGASRNIAIKKCKGEYLLFLDGDDYLYSNDTLSKINNIISKSTPDIAYFGMQYVGGSNKAYLSSKENSTKKARITCDINFGVTSKCWKRQYLLDNNIEFVPHLYYEDMVFSLNAVIKANSLDCGNFPIYNYVRNREGSIMSTPNVKRCSDMYRMLAYVMDLYPETPDEYKPYLLSFIKNETLSLPGKISIILKSLKENKMNPVFDKRDFKFDENDSDINI